MGYRLDNVRAGDVDTLLGIPGAVVLSMGSLTYQANEAPVYVIGRKRGADVQRAAVGSTCRRRDVSGPVDPAHRGPLSFANAQRIADRMAPLGARLGRERMFFNVNRAVETYLARQSCSSQQPGR